MVKGFIRLWAVLTILVWGGAIVKLWHESRENLYLFVNPHLIPAVSLVGTSAGRINTSPAYAMSRWCIVIARPEFLVKPVNERVNIAKAFFDKHIEPIARKTYVDVETFRTKFVTSATLSLEEVPIQKWVDAKGTRYRDISKHAWHGGMRLSNIAFSLTTLLAAVLGGAMLATVLAPVIAGRWAYWGFAARLAFVVWVVWMLGIGWWFWRGYSQQTADIVLGIKLARDADALELVTSSISLAQMQALELAFMTHPLTVVMICGVVGLGLPLLLYSMLRGVLRWVVRGFKPDIPH